MNWEHTYPLLLPGAGMKGPQGILLLGSSLLKDRGSGGFQMVQLQDGDPAKNLGS